MKIFKSSFVFTAAVLIISAATVARANDVTDGTYYFYATDHSLNYFDGSSITWSGDSIQSWDLLDSFASGGFLHGAPTQIPLTPSNSSITEEGTFGAGDWYFIIDSDNLALYPADHYEGVSFDGPGYLYGGADDPAGTWGPAATPDAASTFELLGGAFIALGFMRSRISRR